MNITKKELDLVKQEAEAEAALQILSGDEVKDRSQRSKLYWVEGKKRSLGYRNNANLVHWLYKVKGRITMAWVAEYKDKAIAEADSLDGLMEMLLKKELPDDAEVRIIHV